MNESDVMMEKVRPAVVGSRLRFEIRDKTWRWILLMPAVVTVVALLAVPVLWTLYAAFTDIHLFRIGVPTHFVGFANFEKLLKSESFWRTVRNTVVFMLGVVPTQLIIGMVIALCVNNITLGRKFFRTWFLMPLMISPVVVAFVVGRMLFQEDVGPINEILRMLGFHGIPWLTNPTWAMVALILIDVWQGSSFMILMLMAGLQGVPPDLHEAARVDGATALTSFLADYAAPHHADYADRAADPEHRCVQGGRHHHGADGRRAGSSHRIGNPGDLSYRRQGGRSRLRQQPSLFSAGHHVDIRWRLPHA